MNVLEKRVENQVHFWALIGPFLILLSIAVLLYKLSSHWYFPLSTLIGIPLCVKWKMKGMAAALATLFSFSFLGYQTLEVDERFWHVGMSLALAFSFIILTLSLEEVEGLIDKLQNESKSRLDNYLRLSEELKTAELEWTASKERLSIQMMALSRDLSAAQEEKELQHKLAVLSKDELLDLRSNHEKLIEHLHYKKIELVHLNEKLEQAELAVQSFVNSEPEKIITTLNQTIGELEEEKSILTQNLFACSQERSVIQSDHQRLSNECAAYKQQEQLLFAELAAQKNMCRLYENEKSQIEASQIKLHNEIEELATLKSLSQKQEERASQLEALLANRNHEFEVIANQNKSLAQQFVLKESECRNLSRLSEELRQKMQENEERWNASLHKIRVECEGEKQHIQTALQQAEETLQRQQLELISRDKKLEALKEEHHQLLQELKGHGDSLALKEAEREQLLIKCAQLETLGSQFAQDRAEWEACVYAYECFKKEVATQLSAKEENLQKMEEECGTLKNQLQMNTAKLVDKEGELASLQLHLEALNQEIQAVPVEKPVDLRVLEGKYTQLREQFVEKSQVLDQTRRELFETEEKRLALLKDIEEKENYSLTGYDEALQKEFIKLGAEMEKYEQEIEQLNAIIESLIIN
ncbi:MAG: hypothetical protein LW832_03115 [Parachlamydia sp.]|nr:hypothetical protein [Parachlamydia sp.]